MRQERIKTVISLKNDRQLENPWKSIDLNVDSE